MTPRPSGVRRMRSVDLETSGSPKNASAPCCSSSTILRSSTPAVADDRPPMPFSSALPSSLGEVLEHRRAGRRGRAAAGRSGRRSRRPAPATTTGSRWRRAPWPAAAGRTTRRGPHRDAGAVAAERQNVTGAPAGRPVEPELLDAGRDLVARLARLHQAGEVALDVGGEHRHALRRQLLGQELQRLGLAGAGRAGDEAVAVAHRRGHLHDGLGVRWCRRGPPARSPPRRRPRRRRRRSEVRRLRWSARGSWPRTVARSYAGAVRRFPVLTVAVAAVLLAGLLAGCLDPTTGTPPARDAAGAGLPGHDLAP